VTDGALSCWSESDQQAIREQLARIVHSGPFLQSRRRQRFLEYIVSETLAGRSERLKGYAIALSVFDRPETFDPVVDPIVRIEAARLREKLRDYYDTEGLGDPIRIDLIKGSYAPHIEFRHTPQPEPRAPASKAEIPVAKPPELHPDAEQALTGSVDAQVSPAHSWLKRALRRQSAAAAVALILALLAAGAWLARDHWGPAPQKAAEGPTSVAPTSATKGPAIAVLPFVNLSGDPKQDYFSDGLTEDIMTELARARDLSVLARNTTFQFKGKAVDVMKLGRELGVRYVLEGSVRRIDDRLRVTAQLIDAETGAHVWADRFDREMADVLLVQDEIVSQIVGKVAGGHGAIESTEAKSAARKSPDELQAYDLVLRARKIMVWDWTSENFRIARVFLNQAIALDPSNARARRELAWFAVIGWVFGLDETPVPSGEIIAQATKAVQLDPADARARMVAASAYFFTKQLDLFQHEADQALALAPNDAEIIVALACMISSAGDHKRGVELAKKANALNADATIGWYHSTVYTALYLDGDYEGALDVARQNKEPGMFYSYLEIIPILGQLGRKQEALEAWKNLRAEVPNASAGTFESWWRLWNISDGEVAKLMDGVHRSGVLTAGEAKGAAIAVLPFVNLSGDPKQEYFSDGLTEDIMTELARARDLRVLARNTTFQYKGRTIDVMKLGRELGVRYVLEGSVRRTDDRLRVTAQLIDATTGGHVWAERFDRTMADVLLVQDEIVSKIVAKIAGNYGVIDMTEARAATRKNAYEIQAYDLVLRAQDVMRPEWSSRTFNAAKDLLRQAIALDPANARALRELAWLAAIGWVFRFDTTPAPPQEIVAQALKAVQLDPADARARMVAAAAYFWTNHLDLFQREADQAMALAPFDGEILATLGCMIAVSGQWQRGVSLAEKANALNPDAAIGWYHHALFYNHYMKGEYERALEFRRLHPDQQAVHAYVEFIPVLGQLGRKQEALEYWRKLKEAAPDWTVKSFESWYRLWNASDEDIAKFMDGIRKSGVLAADAKPGQ